MQLRCSSGGESSPSSNDARRETPAMSRFIPHLDRIRDLKPPCQSSSAGFVLFARCPHQDDAATSPFRAALEKRAKPLIIWNSAFGLEDLVCAYGQQYSL
eukprot:3231760-Amphidinium_carterae.1